MLPYLITLAIINACFSSSIWRFIDDSASISTSRVTTIDGMRGYLALSVMLHHAVVARSWLTSGAWGLPSDWLFSQLGSMAVALFFMITGYLFWGKLLAQDGRVDWTRLYISRIFRIAPIYWIAVTGLVIVVFAQSDFQLREAPGNLTKALAHWYALGFLVQHDFNGYEKVWIILAGVVWTLKYEWRFYFALLPASFFAKPRLHMVFSIVLLAVSIIGAQSLQADSWRYLTIFAIGVVTASLAKEKLQLPLVKYQASAITLLAFCATFLIHPSPYSTVQALLLGTAFFLIATGADLFGLLSTPAAIRLGHASYGIYLLQGFIFSVGFRNEVIHSLIAKGVWGFWLVTAASALMLSIVAAILYALIERPTIKLGYQFGKNVSASIKRWRTPKNGAESQVKQ